MRDLEQDALLNETDEIPVGFEDTEDTDFEGIDELIQAFEEEEEKRIRDGSETQENAVLKMTDEKCDDGEEMDADFLEEIDRATEEERKRRENEYTPEEKKRILEKAKQESILFKQRENERINSSLFDSSQNFTSSSQSAKKDFWLDLSSSDNQLSKVGRAALETEIEYLLNTVEGERNDQLNRSAYILGKNSSFTGITEDDVLNALGPVAEDIGLSENEIDRTIMSGFLAGQRDAPRSETKSSEDIHKYTEFGDARLFTMMYKDVVKSTCNGWFYWDENKWISDSKGLKIKQLTDGLVKHYEEELKTSNNRKKIESVIQKVSTNNYRSNVIKQVQFQKEILVDESDFDSKLHLFNVKNGTLNLQTFNLQPHDSADLITKKANVEFDPEAQSPVFNRFLRQIFMNDEETILFVQKIMGHALTGNPKEQRGYFFQGKGGNGKTTFVQAILSLVGDYGKEIDSRIITTKTNELASLSQRAQLRGIRFVFGTELPLGSYLDEALFKNMTGSDSLSAKKMHQDIGSIKTQFKLFLQGNHLPKFYGSDEGIKRRICVIPFSIKASQVDFDLPEKLLLEKSGILNWMLQGLKACQEDSKLIMPTRIKLASEAYISGANVIQNFIDECCEKDECKADTTLREMYNAFEIWCKNSNTPSVGIMEFGNQLIYMGYNKYKKNTAWFWRGITLKK